MLSLKKKHLFLIVSIVLMVSGVGLAYSTQAGFGTVVVSEVDFQAADGSNIHSTLQRPIYATSSDPLPGVVVIHGSLQSKEWLMAFGIELARRGFVVLTIDANGHGNSDAGAGSGAAALEYIADLDYVDSSSIGLIGHSMGGGISWSAIDDSTVSVRALVLVGSWAPSDPTSVDYVPNLLITVGDFDSLSSYPTNTTPLEAVFNTTDVQPGQTYGDFDDNSARRLVIARTNHLFETIDPLIVSESVEWMKDSLKSGVEDEHWVSSGQMVYSLWLFGGFLGVAGAVLSIFPLAYMLLEIPFFSELKEDPLEEYTANSTSFWKHGILYGLIGFGMFYPMLIIGQILDAFLGFPQRYGVPVSSWILGVALVGALALYFVTGRNEGLEWSSFWKAGKEGTAVPTFLKTSLIALILVGWLYGLTLIVDLGLALDFRCFLPGLNDLTLSRALFVPFYFAICFFYFLVDGVWLMGVLRLQRAETPLKTYVKWGLAAVVIKTLPYLIPLSIEFGVGTLTGVAVVPGLIGYTFLFFYAFTPWFVASSLIAILGYRLTGRYYLGAILNALIFAWLIATILAFPASLAV